MKTTRDINLELCRALGVADTSGLTKLQLTIEAGKAPQLVLHRLLIGADAAQAADRIQTVVEHLQLKPVQMPAADADKPAP